MCAFQRFHDGSGLFLMEFLKRLVATDARLQKFKARPISSDFTYPLSKASPSSSSTSLIDAIEMFEKFAVSRCVRRLNPSAT
jgi:hypothetical protein